MTQEQFAVKLTEQFPEKKTALAEHYHDYHELRGHVFFADEINIPLVSLLMANENMTAINRYCAFIEEMWFYGNDSVKNIVEVTILERLTDDPAVWQRFGRFISKDFRWIINDQILPLLALDVPKLSTERAGKRRKRQQG